MILMQARLRLGAGGAPSSGVAMTPDRTATQREPTRLWCTRLQHARSTRCEPDALLQGRVGEDAHLGGRAAAVRSP